MRMRWAAAAAIAAGLSVAAAGTSAAQGPLTPSAGAWMRAEYLRDLAVLERKYVALAEAFPAALFDWRPAEGIRSVHEVIAVVTAENAALVPASFGQATMAGSPAGLQPAIAMFAARDRAALLADLRASFAFARAVWNRLSDADLERSWDFFGSPMEASRIALATMADQHEHLGQLIAYARANGVVPPWSAGRGR